ncbi:MAG: recombinase family protein [Firmicutes bacterium]|nr:recombinase family protein [Bacillota bacterium]
MKNRYTAPYGYTIIQGITEIHPDEAPMVRRIFADYLAGASLQRIAAELTARKVEYLPGKSDWNKNRVKRILEDARYIGSAGLPVIVDEATYNRAGAAKGERNNQPAQQAPRMILPVICAACGAKMQRRHEPRCKCPERWYCPACGETAGLQEGEMEGALTDILNRLITQPDLVADGPAEEQEQPLILIPL